MRRECYGLHFSVSLLLLAVSVSTFSNESYSPYLNQQLPQHVYWGDTHVHTKLSTDAYSTGNRLDASAAYRFARGEAVTTSEGYQVRLRRPLDFLVVADHGENMGVLADLDEEDSTLLNSPEGKALYDIFTKVRDANNGSYMSSELYSKLFTQDGLVGLDYKGSIWNSVIETAEKFNQPGKFTAFIGYEWTAMIQSAHLHRVVIFKDGADEAGRVLPFTKLDSNRPEDLWSYLDAYEGKTGGEALAIPHNGNLSEGRLFALKDSDGLPLTTEYAQQRSRWETLVEVTQVKGDGETHPVLSPTDEFADYETWSDAKYSEYHGEAGNRMRPYEYARSGLKLGLQQQAELGVNPFKFGMIGSTDSHTSLATADNDNFWGKNVVNGPAYPRRMLDPRYPDAKNIELGWRLNASGYAGVWATENTREALFAAMKRKEVYASTGPRMTVRFFGGWDYSADDAFKPDFATIGYARGVPMGGDLANVPKDKAPSFLVRAVKDPDGANLDRIQIVKGWLDIKGETHEKIYNVALSDGRVEDENGKAPPVGNTVNVADTSYVNSIGDPELAVVWTDPDFNPDELAFYYLRVLEIPTPRWTAYDAKIFELKDIPKEVPMITQERAYTSPIWYSPNP